MKDRLILQMRWSTVLWFALAALAVVAVTVMDARAGTDVLLGWDTYAPPGDFSHAALMQSEQNADGSWTDWHEIERPLHTALTHTVPNLADGTYRWQLWAVDSGGEAGVGNTALRTVEDTTGPPPAIPNFRVITTTVVSIKGGQIVAHRTNTRVEPLSPN